MNFIGTNNQDTIIFGFSPSNEIRFLPKQKFNAVIVTGAGTPEYNGTFVQNGELGNKPYYIAIEDTNREIYWYVGDQNWQIYESNLIGGMGYLSFQNTEFPWEAEWSEFDGASPSPTLIPTNVYNAIIVSDTADANGTYTERGTYNNRPYYNLVGVSNNEDTESIIYGTNWAITDVNSDTLYYSDSYTGLYPWEITDWSALNGVSLSPTLAPTFVW